VRKGYLKMEWISIHFAVDAGTGQAVSMDATSERVGVGRRPRRPVGDAKGEGGSLGRSPGVAQHSK